MWIVIVFDYGIYVFYDACMCYNMSLFVYGLLRFWKAYFVCVFNCFIDIEATGSSGIVEDHHHTIELYFGTF
ncbi:hypothetical protein F383_18659 [Gossypium arboreum]|uniref:Uncharacterized protein n=1 Tax=Gossypium arboreum TaxID=29729 RepID=A0A0B0MJW2_GOSAR|nr:hypothetical protein F383_18659 [Gossypium arboreum]